MTKNRIVLGAIAAITMGAGIAASVAPAEAQYRYYGHRGGFNPGAAAAIGAVGGLALGAAIAGSRPAYGAPVYGAPVYGAPVYGARPVYAEPVNECYVTRRRVWVPGWGWDVRRETVCDY
ncbi:hypothetical protein GCM10007036_32890 [Alsobacter metallidurans]|uniref:Uncharacterized protein n=1 Tax=Alsobacter metallidurans TaxID=340221 RepID=A0A917MJA3_9HYPH|nr:hypothetical protein [Alsobacter metallidurans]GGH25650.1 hypothetical protein GCM10007036_32890 [Alsobacter metallidurans]